MNVFTWIVNLGVILLAALILLVAGFAAGYDYEHGRARQAMDAHLAADRQAEASAQIAARTHEYQLSIAANDAAQSYEQGKHDAQIQADRTTADLLDGNLRMQNRWAGCEADRVSEAAASAGQLDAAKRDRAASASRIIAAAAACDSQVKGLQALVIAERK